MSKERDIEFFKELTSQLEESTHIKEEIAIFEQGSFPVPAQDVITPAREPVANPTIQMQGTAPIGPEVDQVNSPLVATPTGAVTSNLPSAEQIKRSAIVDDKSYLDGWNRTENYRKTLGNGMQISTINGGSLEYGYGNPTEQREYLCWNSNGYFISNYADNQFRLNNQPVQVDLWRELPNIPK